MRGKHADIVEIQQLLAYYALAVDARDADAVAGCFTADGVFASSLTGETRGRDEIRALFERKRLEPPDGRRHFILNPHVEVGEDGATATFRAYVLATRAQGSAVDVVFTGSYHGDLVRADDRWFFASRHMTADFKPERWA